MNQNALPTWAFRGGVPLSLWVTEMKVAMARLEPNKPTVMPMVTEESLVRTVVIDNMVNIARSQPALDHFEPGAKPACDRACRIMKVCTKATNNRQASLLAQNISES